MSSEEEAAFEALALRIRRRLEEREMAIIYAAEIERRNAESFKLLREESLQDFFKRVSRLLNGP